MANNLPHGCTDTDIDESSGGYYQPVGTECSHCGEKIEPKCGVWVEPDNMGFSGWDNGHWLCEQCAEDWKWGALDL